MKNINLKQHQNKTIILKEGGDYTITLSEGSNVSVKGAFWLKGDDNLNLNLTIIHAARHTSADTVIKAVVDDQAYANIRGTIIVNKGASQTNSFLKENILLISASARAEAVPNLEILSNDVKCSHAATVGKIDPNQLFYLQSRGLPDQEAKALIAKGFLAI